MMMMFLEDPVPEQPHPISRLVAHFGKNQWLPNILAGSVLATATTVICCYYYYRCRQRRRRSDRKRPKPKNGTLYPGIRNIGNSCFLNCILQALASVHCNLRIAKNTPFSEELDNLLTLLNTPNEGTLDASKLVNSMGGVLNREQQDAHEMLQAILTVLTKYRPPEGLLSLGNPVSNTYPTRSANIAFTPWEGTQVTCLLCTACGQISDSGTKILTFSMMTLTLHQSLSEAYHASVSPETINDYRCKCGQVGSAVKLTSTAKWPELLVIHVQRIGISGYSLVKEEQWMNFPVRLQAWKDQIHLLKLDNVDRPDYLLAAVVEHRGGVGGGHYTTYRRVLDDNCRVRWLHCSDSSIKKVSLEDVLSAEAYLLLYTKIAK